MTQSLDSFRQINQIQFSSRGKHAKRTLHRQLASSGLTACCPIINQQNVSIHCFSKRNRLPFSLA